MNREARHICMADALFHFENKWKVLSEKIPDQICKNCNWASLRRKKEELELFHSDFSTSVKKYVEKQILSLSFDRDIEKCIFWDIYAYEIYDVLQILKKTMRWYYLFIIDFTLTDPNFKEMGDSIFVINLFGIDAVL